MTRTAVLLAGGVTLAAASTRAQTVDQIIARNLAARGGVERLHAMQTQRLVGRIAFGSDSAMPFVTEIKRPGKMRNEIVMQGKTVVQTTGGASGWTVNPLSGSSEARPLSQDELRNMAGGADLEGPLLNYAVKGNRVELIGRVQVEGKDAWKLRVTLADGDVRYDYVDAESYLETKWEGTVRNNGREIGVESWFRDYRPVNGVMISWLIDSDTPGTAYTQKIVFDSVTVDQPIDDTRFGRP
jgi:hypothetical protein